MTADGGDPRRDPRRDALRATLLVAASACSFGSIAPLTVIATRGGAPLAAVQGWRYLTSAVLLSLVAAWWNRRGADGAGPPRATPAPAVARWWHPRVLLVAGGGQALVATLALAALRYIPAATAGFLFYTYPAWVALLAALRGTERIDGRRVVALLLAIGGIGAMVGTPAAGAMHPAGAALALAAALWYALYIPILGRLQRDRAPLDVALAISWGGAACFLGYAVARGVLLTHADTLVLGASALQGLLSTVAFVGFLAGLRTLGPVRAAITSTVEPFWTTVLGVLLLAQPPGPGLLLGGVAIAAGVVLLQGRTSTAGAARAASGAPAGHRAGRRHRGGRGPRHHDGCGADATTFVPVTACHDMDGPPRRAAPLDPCA